MAASATTMPKTPKTPAPEAPEAPAAAPPITEAELRAAFKTRGIRILDAITTQARNAENLTKTKKARGSEHQVQVYHDALRTLAARLVAVADSKPSPTTTGIPDN